MPGYLTLRGRRRELANKVRKIGIFQPDGQCAQDAAKIAAGAGWETVEYDLTSFDARWQKYMFSAEDLVPIGMPHYGRIRQFPKNFSRIRPENTPAVFVVSME